MENKIDRLGEQLSLLCPWAIVLFVAWWAMACGEGMDFSSKPMNLIIISILCIEFGWMGYMFARFDAEHDR